MKRGEPYHTSVGRFMKLPETFEENLSTISFAGAEVERNEYRGGLWGGKWQSDDRSKRGTISPI